MEAMCAWVMERKDAKSHEKLEEAAKTTPKSVQKAMQYLNFGFRPQSMERIHHVLSPQL